MEKLRKGALKIIDIFTGALNKVRVKGLIAYFAVISLLEILAYMKNGIFSVLASRIWLFTAVILIGLCVYQSLMILCEDIKNKAVLNIVGYSIIFILFCFYIGNLAYSDVNADAAQQAAAGLSSFETKDWNYTGVGFLGYANRQYVLAAIPALLFGRSIFTLHLGFAFPFLIGLTLLYIELRKWLKNQELNEVYALIPVYVLPAFRFITEYFMNFEQAITPVALTMIGVALFLRLVRRNDLLSFIALAWVGCFACDSYTPVLASLGLLLCFYVLYAFHVAIHNVHESDEKKRTENWFIVLSSGASVINILMFFAATVMGERSDRIEAFREEVSIKAFAIETWKEFFTDANAVFLGVFAGIILLYLALSLLGRLKFHDFTIACWVFGVVFFANYMVGYTSYEKAWILQRNMIIIPVLVTSIFMTAMNFIKKYKIKANTGSICSLLLFFCVIGVANFSQQHQSFNYFRYIQPMKYMLEYTEEAIDEYGYEDMDEFNIVLFTDNGLQTNIYDYTKFLFPNAHAVSFSVGSYPENIDESLPTFYFSESDALESIVENKVESRQYTNKRYKTSCTWYMSFAE